MLKNTIKKSKQKSQTALINRESKIKSRKASTFNILFFFTKTVYDYWDIKVTYSKEEKNRVNSLIKYLKNNGFSDVEVFEWLEDIVKNWDKYANKKTATDKGKEYMIHNYPNLGDIIYCKKFFLTPPEKVKEDKSKEMNVFDLWDSLPDED